MLRLLFYDRTCLSPPFLTQSWWIGAHLFSLTGRFDHTRGVSSWEEALTWLATVGDDQPIDEIQYWGHGKWGNARIHRDVLEIDTLTRSHASSSLIDRIAARLRPASLWWFRTCETFGARAGHEFAPAFTERLGCRTAGHTYIIGPWQSGLHTLSPGDAPEWSAAEGLVEGSPEKPTRALWSTPSAPHTIHCLRTTIPAGY